MTLAYSTAIRNARADAIANAVGANALLRFYDGVRPASGGTATTLLGELACDVTFAPSASGGVLTINTIDPDLVADASGTATWFRIVTSAGVFCIDGSVGIAGSGADIIMNSVTFTAGGSIAITSFTITEGNA